MEENFATLFKIEDFVEVYFVTLFKDFVIKMLAFCSNQPCTYLLGENILQIENFMNLAKS